MAQLLYQDDAGTSPVLQDNDPIGLARDVAGNPLNLSQANSQERPSYRTGTPNRMRMAGDRSLKLNLSTAITGTFVVVTDDTVIMQDASLAIGEHTVNPFLPQEIVAYGMSPSPLSDAAKTQIRDYYAQQGVSGGFDPRELDPNMFIDLSSTAEAHAWQRNLLEYSNDLEHPYWSQLAASRALTTEIIQDYTIAEGPNEVRLYDVVENTALSEHAIFTASGNDLEPNTEYHLSVYAKAAGLQYMALRFTQATGTRQGAIFDVLNGVVVSTTGGTARDPKITPILDLEGNIQCYRIEVIVDSLYDISPSSVWGRVNINLLKSPTIGSTTYQGDGISNVLLGGVHMQLASTANKNYQEIITAGTSQGLALQGHVLYQEAYDRNVGEKLLAVNPGDPIGWIIDKSRAHIPTQNLSDTSAQTPFNATAVASGDGFILTSTVNSFVELRQTISGMADKTYRMRIKWADNDARKTITLGVGGNDHKVGQSIEGEAVATIRSQNVSTIVRIGIDDQTIGQTVYMEIVEIVEVPGNHLRQETDANRPTLGRHPTSGIRNLLDSSEDITSGDWSVGGGSPTLIPNVALDDKGEPTLDFLAGDGVNTFPRVYQAPASAITGNATFSALVREGTSGECWIRLEGTGLGGGGDTFSTYKFTFSNQTLVNQSGYAGASTEVVNLGGGLYRIAISMSCTTITSAIIYSSFGVADTDSIYVGKLQLEEASAMSAYQRRVDQFDITEDGFVDAWYLNFNGVDQSLLTNAVAMDGSSEATVITAQFANDQLVTGNIFMYHNQPWAANHSIEHIITVADDFFGRASGTIDGGGVTVSTPEEDLHSVFSQRIKLDGGPDRHDLRVNRTLNEFRGTALGDGPYTDEIIYIGRDDTNGAPYDGKLYGIYFDNKYLNNADLEAVEDYLAGLAGISL